MTIKNNNKLILLLYISTILIVSLSAYFSVVGISSLFAGKKIFASIMAVSFQLSKITIISILSQKWSQLKTLIKTYLFIAATLLVIISSSGIYSYLADAYQLTLYNSQKSDLKIQNLNQKYNNITQQRTQLTNQIKSIDQQIKSINTASNAFSNNITINNINTIRLTQRQNTNTILQLQKQKTLLHNNIAKLDSLHAQYSDLKFEESTSQSIKQVGPLKQIGELFNTPLNNVVQFFLFIIILIFDPIGIIFLNLINKLEILKTNSTSQQFTVEKIDLPIVDKQNVNYQQTNISTNQYLQSNLNIEKDQLPENIKNHKINKKKLQKKEIQHIPQGIQPQSPQQTIAIF